MTQQPTHDQKEQVFANLDHKLVYKRIQAVRDLEDISDDRVIPSLIKCLSDAGSSGSNHNERVCDVAAEVLERLDTPETKEIVERWKSDPFPFLREALDWDDDKYGIPALREISKFDGDRVIEALMDAMGGYSQNVYEIARDEIVHCGNKAIPRLIQYLNSDNIFRRKTSAYLLGKIGNPMVVPELLVAGDDTNPELRCVIVEALGNLGDERAIEALKVRLYDKEKCSHYHDQRVCDIASKSLLQIATPETVEAVKEWDSLEPATDLITSLQSNDLYVLRFAVWSAGRLGIKEAVQPLLDILDVVDSEIKRGAIWSLGVLRDSSAIKHLLPYTDDEDPLIAKSAIEALQKLRYTRDYDNT